MNTEKATKNLRKLSNDILEAIKNESVELDKRSSFKDYDKFLAKFSSKED